MGPIELKRNIWEMTNLGEHTGSDPQDLAEIRRAIYGGRRRTALYGPKIDIKAKNVYGKEDTMITIQFQTLCHRRKLRYVLYRPEWRKTGVHTLSTERPWAVLRERGMAH